ncbi:hypothetical protein AMJ57_05630 [Parcubacteria bacterium SG8_24]|nr:MAG: hypothetical protein AMJ57_05630 [Parcubacteria bacterium SG8_24]
MALDYLSELPLPRPHKHETRRFPEGFLWGAATSSYQVEGGNDNSDWHDWDRIEGHTTDGAAAGAACDQYRRYEEDFGLAASLGQNAHRLSVEWSRIEPREGEWDMDEVVHYRRVLESLRRRGMKTMLTVWHFTLPKWFAARGGWEARDAVRLFERYTAFLARELGDLVDFWITINEPMVYLVQSYGIGVWPPGRKGPWPVLRVFRRLVRAHRAAYRALHEALDRDGRRVQVGIAKNVITYVPYRRQSLVDSLFVRLLNRLFNHQFFRKTKHHHDFIGVNYYFHYRIRYLPTKISQFFYEVHTENREVSDLGWEINPRAIFNALMEMNRYGLPILITENGIANADDAKRPRMIVATIKEVYHAIRAGVDVRGYFHWSLIDNFEWEKGYTGRFGLVAVDFATQQRTPRRSAYVYQEICRENGLPHTLLKFIGHGIRW